MKRIMLIGLAVIGVAPAAYFFGGPAKPVSAAPAFESETWYYADPEMTNEVGYRYVSCNSGNITQGSPGPNRRVFRGEQCSTGYYENCLICWITRWDPEEEEWVGERVSCASVGFDEFPDCG